MSDDIPMNNPIPLKMHKAGDLAEGKPFPVFDSGGQLVGSATRTGGQVFLNLGGGDAARELARKLQAPHAAISLGYSVGRGPTGAPFEMAVVDEMLPCIFCSSTELNVGVEAGLTRPRVVCRNCGARGPLALSGENREAIANWNRRPGPR